MLMYQPRKYFYGFPRRKAKYEQCSCIINTKNHSKNPYLELTEPTDTHAINSRWHIKESSLTNFKMQKLPFIRTLVQTYPCRRIHIHWDVVKIIVEL